jgi:hypothetical protein
VQVNIKIGNLEDQTAAFAIFNATSGTRNTAFTD